MMSVSSRCIGAGRNSDLLPTVYGVSGPKNCEPVHSFSCDCPGMNPGAEGRGGNGEESDD